MVKWKEQSLEFMCQSGVWASDKILGVMKSDGQLEGAKSKIYVSERGIG